jgi:hypothetical protein
VLLPIQKSAAKLRRCRFKNRQPKAVLLLILKSTAKYCVVAEKLTARTVLLLIQKSAEKLRHC